MIHDPCPQQFSSSTNGRSPCEHNSSNPWRPCAPSALHLTTPVPASSAKRVALCRTRLQGFVPEPVVLGRVPCASNVAHELLNV